MNNLKKRILQMTFGAAALLAVGSMQAVEAQEFIEEEISEEIIVNFDDEIDEVLVEEVEEEPVEAEEVEVVDEVEEVEETEIVDEVDELEETEVEDELPEEEVLEEDSEEVAEPELEDLKEDLEDLAEEAEGKDLPELVEAIDTITEGIDSLITLGDKWSAEDFDTEDIEEFSKTIQSMIDLIPGAEDSLYKPVLTQLTEIAQDISRSVTFGLTGWSDPSNYYRVDTIVPRMHLLKQTVSSIEVSTTELTHKVQDAHIQIGFEVTRSILNMIDPFIQKDALIAQSIRLGNLMQRAHEFKDLEADDIATIYTKANLDRTIWELRTYRDQELLGKISFQDYAAYNYAITQAVGVQLDPTSTVADIDSAVEKLKAIHADATTLLPVGEAAFATSQERKQLTDLISQARHVRDFELLGQVSFDAYHAINQTLTQAVGLQLSPTAKKTAVLDAMAAIEHALENARLEVVSQ